MVRPGYVKRAPPVLAACFLLPFGSSLLAGVLAAILPVEAISLGFGWLPDVGVQPGLLYTLYLPFALAASVLLRGAITRTPADVVLATVAVPCLLVVLWALYTPTSGVNWAPLFTVGSATLLALVVLADAVLDHRISSSSSLPVTRL